MSRRRWSPAPPAPPAPSAEAAAVPLDRNASKTTAATTAAATATQRRGGERRTAVATLEDPALAVHPLPWADGARYVQERRRLRPFRAVVFRFVPGPINTDEKDWKGDTFSHKSEAASTPPKAGPYRSFRSSCPKTMA